MKMNILISQGGEEHAKQQQHSNQLLVPGVRQAIDQMKYEIAQEFGVQLVLKHHRVPTDP